MTEGAASIAWEMWIDEGTMTARLGDLRGWGAGGGVLLVGFLG